MPILHIEHEISDLPTWLETFKPSDDPHYIVVNLRFETVDAASNFRI